MTGAELDDRLLRPGDVARIFNVDIHTVRRWAETGKLACVRTLGGHRRYRMSDVRAAIVDTRNRVA